MKRVVVGLFWIGVDSSVAAYLLQQGYEVIGLLWKIGMMIPLQYLMIALAWR
jgi:tRNA U34 2-thiouridine synthase MnmA/TrmU